MMAQNPSMLCLRPIYFVLGAWGSLSWRASRSGLRGCGGMNRLNSHFFLSTCADHLEGSSDALEIRGNDWETIDGKKILVHEFNARATIEDFSSKDIERVTEEAATAMKVKQIKVSERLSGYWSSFKSSRGRLEC